MKIDLSIIEKISALLRMAEHPNSNEHEAALALEKAQALLLRHNLDRSQLAMGESDSAKTNNSIAKEILLNVGDEHDFRWRAHLLNIIAKNNLCYMVMSTEKKSCHLFGSTHNISAVLGMYSWVKEQLEKMAIEKLILYSFVNEGKERPGQFYVGFFQGAAQIINDRLKGPMEEFSYGTGRDLVLLNDRALQIAVKQEFPFLSKSRMTTGGSEGQAAGRQAGREVKFGRTGALGGPRSLGSGR